jgi:hypothetical protein
MQKTEGSGQIDETQVTTDFCVAIVFLIINMLQNTIGY